MEVTMRLLLTALLLFITVGCATGPGSLPPGVQVQQDLHVTAESLKVLDRKSVV